MILLRKFLQAISDFEDAASFLDLADHLPDDVEEWIILDKLSVVWCAFLAIDHQHQIKRRKQSHSQRVNVRLLIGILQVINANRGLAFLRIPIEILLLGARISRCHSIRIIDIGIRPQNETFPFRRIINMRRPDIIMRESDIMQSRNSLHQILHQHVKLRNSPDYPRVSSMFDYQR